MIQGCSSFNIISINLVLSITNTYTLPVLNRFYSNSLKYFLSQYAHLSIEAKIL